MQNCYTFGVLGDAASRVPARSGPQREFSRQEVVRMLKLSERRLKSWERQGFIPAAERFSFSDLIALRALQQLSAKKIPPRQIGKALTSLKHKLGETARPLNELRILSDGRTIAVQIAGQKMEAISGQLLFDFDASDLPAVTSFRAREAAPARNIEQEAERWFQEGLSLEETGAPVERARSAYERAIEINPQAAGALVNLGTIAFRERRLKDAESYYRRAIAADPNYPLAHYNLGNLFDELGKHDAAREQYEIALGLNPHYADAHFNLALIAEREGRNMAAVRHWKAYLKADPGSAWAAQARKQLERLRRLTVVE